MTGLSGCEVCADTGFDAAARLRRIPSGSAEPDSQRLFDEAK
jgi:hypothetical protein